MSNVTFLPWVNPEDESTSIPDAKGPLETSGGPFGATAPVIDAENRFGARFVPAVSASPATPSEGSGAVPAGESGWDAPRRNTVRFTPHVEPESVSESAAVVDSTPEEENAFDAERVEQTLLRKLHSHDMSVREVEIWLNEQFASREEIADWVEKFVRLGYLNDERLASELATRLSERKGQSRSIISRELRRRGIEASAAEAALDNLDAGAEEAQAAELAMTRVRQFSRLDDATAERRLVGFLSRRGYNGQVVREATKAAMATRTPTGRGGGVGFR
jgi:regulatory protein